MNTSRWWSQMKTVIPVRHFVRWVSFRQGATMLPGTPGVDWEIFTSFSAPHLGWGQSLCCIMFVLPQELCGTRWPSSPEYWSLIGWSIRTAWTAVPVLIRHILVSSFVLMLDGKGVLRYGRASWSSASLFLPIVFWSWQDGICSSRTSKLIEGTGKIFTCEFCRA